MPVPRRLGDGELLVRVTCCTVCGSDLHTLSGRRPGPTPCILGHEIVGQIAAFGDRPPTDLRGRQIQLGDRVVWSVSAACDQCRNCRRGIPQKCQSLRKYGHHKIEPDWQLSGGLAQYCHLVRGTSIVVIDSAIPEQVICPASCATATVASAMRVAGNIAGARVLIMGAGMLGLTSSAMAASLGADSVCVCDVSRERLRLAEQFGSDQSILFDQAKGRLDQRFDTVFEMSGSAEAAQSALQFAAVGGSIVFVGTVLPVGLINVDPEQVVRRLLSIHGVHNYAPQDLLAAIDFLEQSADQFRFADLVSKSFPLGAINEAIAYASQARPIRIAIKPEGDA